MKPAAVPLGSPDTGMSIWTFGGVRPGCVLKCCRSAPGGTADALALGEGLAMSPPETCPLVAGPVVAGALAAGPLGVAPARARNWRAALGAGEAVAVEPAFVASS